MGKRMIVLLTLVMTFCGVTVFYNQALAQTKVNYKYEYWCDKTSTSPADFSQQVQCTSGDKLTFKVDCPGEEKLGPREVKAVCPEPKTPATKESNFKWSLGAGTYWLGVSGQDSAYGLEGVFERSFQVSKSWFFRLELTAGVAKLGDRRLFAPSVLGGLDWRLSKKFYLGFGLRDRLLFDRELDWRHTLLAELSAGFNLGRRWGVVFSGAYGKSWYPEELGSAQLEYRPAGMEVLPNETVAIGKTGGAYSGAIKLNYRF